MATGKYELYRSNNGEFRFRLKASNGETILTGEGYSGRGGATNGIASVRSNGIVDGRFERKEATNGKHYFVLKAGNHQVIAQSQMYATDRSCENGVDSVKRNCVTDRVEDLTSE